MAPPEYGKTGEIDKNILTRYLFLPRAILRGVSLNERDLLRRIRCLFFSPGQNGYLVTVGSQALR